MNTQFKMRMDAVHKALKESTGKVFPTTVRQLHKFSRGELLQMQRVLRATVLELECESNPIYVTSHGLCTLFGSISYPYRYCPPLATWIADSLGRLATHFVSVWVYRYCSEAVHITVLESKETMAIYRYLWMKQMLALVEEALEDLYERSGDEGGDEDAL